LPGDIYSVKALTKADNNTLRCVTGGVTYVPIPPGTGANFAGLLTVALPPGITDRQEFNIVVRRLTWRFPAAAGRGPVGRERNWRYVVGAFQIRVPVSPPEHLLLDEENLLAVFKWKLAALPNSNRWYPVLSRYVGQIAGRVDGFGGNANSVPPSLQGIGGPQGKSGGGGQHHHEMLEYTGKVSGLIYNRFGDFEGFRLLTRAGHEEQFRSHEREIERLVDRAWLERIVISVFVDRHDPHCPVSIIMRRAPRWPA
jgi:hypothetical protein